MSKANYEIVEAKPWHCGAMSRMLRPEHHQALAALNVDPHRELRNVFDDSCFRKACFLDGKLIALWGVTGPILSPDALVWLALSRDIKKYPMALIKEVRKQLDDIMQTKRCLIAPMFDGDEVSERFAVFLGFVPVIQGEYVAPAETKFGRREVARQLKEGDCLRVPLRAGYGKLMIYRGLEA